MFNHDLRLGQDADLWLRLAFHCRLYTGEISRAVCLIRRHDENRIYKTNFQSKIKGLKISIKYFRKRKVSLTDYWAFVFKLYRIYLKNGLYVKFLKDLALIVKF